MLDAAAPFQKHVTNTLPTHVYTSTAQLLRKGHVDEHCLKLQYPFSCYSGLEREGMPGIFAFFFLPCHHALYGTRLLPFVLETNDQIMSLLFRTFESPATWV